MMTTSLRSGLRGALAQPRLVVTVWLWTLLLSVVAGAGLWRWLFAAFNFSPEADKTLQRFHVGMLVELQQYDRFSPFTFLTGAVLALILLSAVSNPLLSAGVLEVLASRDDRPLLHRFLRGAGHFFGRFLRLLVVSAVVFLVLSVLLSAIVSAIGGAFSSAGWERAAIATGLARLALIGALAGLIMAVLDVARTRVVTAPVELRGMVRMWLSAARFVIGHPGTIAGVYLTLGAVWAVLAVTGLGIVSAVPVTSHIGIWLLIGVQQLFMLARAALRVTRAGAVLHYVTATAERAEAAQEKTTAYPEDTAVSLPGA